MQSRAPGVIDTLGLGYAALVARPLVLAPLILIEAIVLFSPRVALAPVTGEIDSWMTGRGDGLESVGRFIDRFSSTNVVDLVTVPAPLLRSPGIVSTLSAERLRDLPWSVSFSSAPMLAAIAVALAAVGVGLMAAVAFRLLLAAECLGVGARRDLLDARLVGLMALRLAGWAMAIAGVATLVAMPAIVMTAFGLVFGFGGSELIWILLILPFAWGFVHFYFSVHALFVDRVGPFDALRSSYQVVSRNFWQSIQFIATTMLMTTGVTYALQQLARGVGGVVAALAINSFVVTGIIVAAMLFYRDRARLLAAPVDNLGR